eukprot:TRINITY_DN20760_c1_g1_i1.p2 TRINITY_DN20760_c1_g1~~TRINITY_DN20760_c1_g1_i1.p2  ORF type:complete len:101 (-),score=7.63 TRINITY_DN20760_c1_g1_i1:469-771(-)
MDAWLAQQKLLPQRVISQSSSPNVLSGSSVPVGRPMNRARAETQDTKTIVHAIGELSLKTARQTRFNTGGLMTTCLLPPQDSLKDVLQVSCHRILQVIRV